MQYLPSSNVSKVCQHFKIWKAFSGSLAICSSRSHFRVKLYTSLTSPSFCKFHTTPLVSSQWCVNKPFANPLDELEEHYVGSEKIVSPKDRAFDPSDTEVESCQKLFRPKPGKTIEANRGVMDLKDLPPVSLPEVCFVGRSNVGKSSLVKSLFFNASHVDRITISKKPGHTRTLKFYSIDKRFSLVDMPGYGHNMPEHYVESVEQYLQIRASLQRVFLLLDASVGIAGRDEIGINMLEEMGRPYTMVLTKIDKISHSRVLHNLLGIQEFRKEHMPSCFPQPFLVSAHTGAGLALLRTLISYVTGNTKIHNV